MGGDDSGKGRSLANYIITAWKSDFGQDWWVSATIVEAHLINDDFETSILRFQEALKKCKPEIFDVESTRQQIVLYKHFKEENHSYIQDVIELLDEYLT